MLIIKWVFINAIAEGFYNTTGTLSCFHFAFESILRVASLKTYIYTRC